MRGNTPLISIRAGTARIRRMRGRRSVLRGGGGGDAEDTATSSTGGAGLPLGSKWLQELNELEGMLSKILERQQEYESFKKAKFDEEADDRELLQHEFDLIDKDRKKLICREELDAALLSSHSTALMDALTRIIKDGDVRIDFDGFKKGADQVRV